jgi:hypothetical protein
MSFIQVALFAALGIFFGILIAFECGRKIGLRRLSDGSKSLAKGVGATEGAVFALLGLLIAFTFSGAASRFEARRALLTEEANAIGTAYLRVDNLPADSQLEIRQLFKQYIQLRANQFAQDQLARNDASQANIVQGDIWKKALDACKRPDAHGSCVMLMMPALNQMIDITTTRAMAGQNHPPLIIYLLLGSLSLIAALLVGYGTAENPRRLKFHPLAFAAIVSITLYVIIDLEFPRLGLIRIDDADRILFDLRKSIQQ